MRLTRQVWIVSPRPVFLLVNNMDVDKTGRTPYLCTLGMSERWPTLLHAQCPVLIADHAALRRVPDSWALLSLSEEAKGDHGRIGCYQPGKSFLAGRAKGAPSQLSRH